MGDYTTMINQPSGTTNNGNGVAAPGTTSSQTANTGTGTTLPGSGSFDWNSLLQNLATGYNGSQQVTGNANGTEAFKNYTQQGMGYQQSMLDQIMALMNKSQGDTSNTIGQGTTSGINSINNGTSQGIGNVVGGTVAGTGDIGQGTDAALGLLSDARGLGTGADSQLLKMLGFDSSGNKVAPDYSAFMNSPGYKFSVDQGTNAINRAAAAGGNLYSTNTLANLANYTQGAASTNYNNYMQNLLNSAQQGNAAATNSATMAQQGGIAAGNMALQGGIAAGGMAQQGGIAAGNMGQTGAIDTATQINDLAKAGMSNLFNTGSQIGTGFGNLAGNAFRGANDQTGAISNLLKNGGLAALLNTLGTGNGGTSNSGSIPALLTKLFGGGGNTTGTTGGGTANGVGTALGGAGNLISSLTKLLGGNTGATDANGNPIDMTNYDFSNWANNLTNNNQNNFTTDPNYVGGTTYDPTQGFTYGTGGSTSSTDPFNLGINFSQYGTGSTDPNASTFP